MNTALSETADVTPSPPAKPSRHEPQQANSRFAPFDGQVNQYQGTAHAILRNAKGMPQPKNLRLQVINYHLTEENVDGASLHTLAHREFEHHLNLIQSSQLTVIPASDLTDRIDQHGGQVLAITFDDGSKSDLVNAEKLLKRGLSATFFISSANIGLPGYLDAAEIRELQAMGMSIGSHSHEHVRLTTLPPQVMAAQVLQSKAILEDLLGQAVDRFAFPGGAYSTPEIQAVREAGFRFAFGTDWGLNTTVAPLGPGGVIKRNNVIQGTLDIDFLTLVTLRHTHWRLFVFQAKRLLQTSLPDDLYRRLRDLLIRR